MIIIKTNKVKKIVSICAAITNLILFFIKLYIAISTNSISIYVDSLNSLADTFVCGFAFIGFLISAIKPNKKYPFGYGKIEELINLMLSVVILFTGLAFVYTSLQRLMYPVPVWYSVKYAITICATALVKLIMAIVFQKIEKKEKSDIIKNLSIDSYLDFFMSLCIVVSFTLTNRFGYAIDSIMGIIASLIIIVNGAKSVFSSCCDIIGKRDNTLLEEVQEYIESIDGVENVTNIQCHSYGSKKVICVNITVGYSSTDKVIELCELLKNKVKKEFEYELLVTLGGIV